jgi:hypothetical protein
MTLRTIRATNVIGGLAVLVAWLMFVLFPRSPFDHSWRTWGPGVIMFAAWYLLARGAKGRLPMLVVSVVTVGSMWLMWRLR